MSKNQFQITEFTEYASVSGQYSEDFIRQSRCVKVSEQNGSVLVAAAESAITAESVLRSVHFPKKVQLLRVTDGAFAEFVGSIVESHNPLSELNQKQQTLQTKNNDKDFFCLDAECTESAAVNIINAILLEALRKNASDIHIQSTKTEANVRFRIDGRLVFIKKLSLLVYESVLSRIKIMASLNVMENRLPQDGHIQVNTANGTQDFRVSVIPVSSGQSVVIRLFNGGKTLPKLNELGFSDHVKNQLMEALKSPHGLILLTGPTGSGKSTTLHALLCELNSESLKIVTIEDPVERTIEGADQIQVQADIGLTFDAILRRVLRQDPDVIMVGEIRDAETARLAVRAALTGHLILSTLHTNSSTGTIDRLKNMGIEPYLIAGTLRCAAAQRLVRKLCKNCGGKGCSECNNTGYKGRTVVAECFSQSDRLKTLIQNGEPEQALRNFLIEHGFVPITEDAKQKLLSGITDEHELEMEALL